MSYDRLRVDRDLRDTITVRGIGSGNYRAVAIPPSFTLGPVFARRLLRIRKFDAAIRKAELLEETIIDASPEGLHASDQRSLTLNGSGLKPAPDCPQSATQ